MLYVYMYLFIALFNFFNNTYFDLKTKQKIKQHFGTTVRKTKKQIPKTFLWLHTHTHNKVLFPFKKCVYS